MLKILFDVLWTSLAKYRRKGYTEILEWFTSFRSGLYILKLNHMLISFAGLES